MVDPRSIKRRVSTPRVVRRPSLRAAILVPALKRDRSRERWDRIQKRMRPFDLALLGLSVEDEDQCRPQKREDPAENSAGDFL